MKLASISAIVLLDLLFTASPSWALGAGGQTIFTTSTKTVDVNQYNVVTDTVNLYSTTIDAQLDDGTPIFTQTNPAPLSDPTVQAAINAADALLISAGQAFGDPAQESSQTVLQGRTFVQTPGTPFLTSSTVTTRHFFGPVTIQIGDNESQTFDVPAGTIDQDTLTTSDYTIPIGVVTTNTYLTTESYLITGVVPEPANAIPAIAGLAVFFSVRP